MNFKSYFRKKAIALKRNFYTVPFVLNLIALIVFSCAIFVHTQSAALVIYEDPNQFMFKCNDLNALFIFIITLSSILGVVAYIKYMGRVKNYFMFGVYNVLAVIQAVLEVIFVIGVINQLDYEKDRTPVDETILSNIKIEQNSIFLVYLHLALLLFAVLIAAFAPLIQKKLKKIKFSRMGENESKEVKAEPAEETK